MDPLKNYKNPYENMPTPRIPERVRIGDYVFVEVLVDEHGKCIFPDMPSDSVEISKPVIPIKKNPVLTPMNEIGANKMVAFGDAAKSAVKPAKVKANPVINFLKNFARGAECMFNALLHTKPMI